MPNIKSAIKRVSVTEHKTLRNKMVRSSTKTAVKKFDTAVAEKTANAEMLSAAASAVDKAAAKGVISKNAANRQKARMARELAKA
ncbi:MAG: 30S ribosomal protein S20 [Clostridia bacterium]|nr:30S ribosomal protein S20 [Afipia sp.]MBR1408901.1 30S ribosomal protein S20 [Clostridia bacterium]